MTDNPSSNFFIEKEVNEPEEQQETKRNRLALVILISTLYAMIAACIATYINMKGFTPATGIAFYAYGLIGGCVVIVLRKIYTQSEQSHQMLIEMLNTSSVSRIITNKDQETVYTNDSFNVLTSRFGTPSLENFIKLFDKPLKVERQLNKISEKSTSSKSAVVELSTTINDKEHFFEVTALSVVNWPDHTHWRIEDITKHYKMQIALSERQEKLLDFTNNAPVGFFSVDESGKFLFANDTLADWLGTTPDDIRKSHVLHDFVRSIPSSTPYQCFKDNKDIQSGEVTLHTKDGQELKALITHALSHDEEGKIHTRSIVYDLTSEQKIRQALQTSQSRFQHLFEDAPIGICLLSSDYTITESNRGFSHLIGKSSDKIKNNKLNDYIIKSDCAPLDGWLESIANEDAIPHSSIEITLKGENKTVVQLYARKFKGESSLVLHFIDLTEKKNLEEQFTQSQKMQAIGQLAGGIAHDFNNLLTAMIGFCDLLLLRHKPGNPSFSDIMQIKQNANRAANLVRQLLAFSRQQTLQPKVLDLTDVLTELSHLLRRLIGASIDLKIEHSSELGLIKADQGQMEQVLINLTVNARDAMKDGGKIHIKTKNISVKKDTRLKGDDILPAGQWITIAVKDEGTGIDPQNLSRIFEPFFSTKEVGAGTGLGLSTVHGIVHQTGGALSVDSTIGEGTTFTIYLPHHNATEDELSEDLEEAEIAKKQEAADLTGSAKILLVEDEDAVRTFSSRALSNKGYDTLDAGNGVLALELIKAEKPDLELLITDVVMPEMDGPTVAKEIKVLYPNIKIIFMSGYTEDKMKEDWHGEADFLPKPFSLKQLATKVKDVLGE